MYGFMRGFQRWVWWPKCTPASINCCIVTVGTAMVNSFPVMPLDSWNPIAEYPAKAPVCAPSMRITHRHGSGSAFNPNGRARSRRRAPENPAGNALAAYSTDRIEQIRLTCGTLMEHKLH